MTMDNKHYITRDELWNWQPSKREFADAQIPTELISRLQDAIQMYINVCNQINAYLEANPEDEIKI